MERQQVLEEIRSRISAAGGRLVMPAKALASELGLKPQRMYNLINSFERSGEIATLSRGPIGTELRVGTGKPVEASAARGRADRRVRAAGGNADRKYCPWCGATIADDRWHYCASCGKALPR